jgi:topoisomerase IV subunit A
MSNHTDESTPAIPDKGDDTRIIGLQGMYQDYFLDYASYVILERAVPAIEDGLKPVQRRILHTMYELDDGRYHKVANIIGYTMQFHPHGDAAIGDALVNMGQRDLLIDCQGNWGDVRTGDSAAAARYIEGRLTKFALDVAFNPQTTHWQLSYDGRKKEPITLPVKFPLVLVQGVEGIAVGLSTKILPHNFIEIIEASIDILRGKSVKIYPDFPTGGMVDVSDYNSGARGGKVKVRAKIEIVDRNTLAIRDLPFSVTTGSLIESIVKANDKGKIKIKKVVDNTAQHVEILIDLAPGASPDVTVDALYAFTDCELSISPNACVIVEDKPVFTTVENILRISTENTRRLLGIELEIRQHELEEKWHFASLEKIFIEKRIYHQIEECESWEEVMSTIYRELARYVATPADPAQPGDQRLQLLRELSDDDITRLTEIRIKRISKYNAFKADEQIAGIEAELEQVKFHLAHLTDYAVAYFQRLLEKYGQGRERRTLITTFDTIQATEVVANNAKLYVNRIEGFIGWGMKKDEFVCDCSDIDDIIVFRRDGKFQVSRISEKVFVGKDIIHVAVWKKNDERTTYNMAYLDGKSGRSFVKRFNVTAITRDREYELTQGNANSKLLYFSANPNGEAETVTITLAPSCKAKIKIFDYDFASLEIKGRSSQGNTLSRYPVKKVVMKEAGKSTLGAQTLWIDEVSGKLNTDSRGRMLGNFDSGEQLFLLFKDGSYEVADPDLARRFDMDDFLFFGKFNPEMVISAVHFDGHKGWTLVKRFRVETTATAQRFAFITDHKDSRLLFASVKDTPRIEYSIKIKGKKIQGEVNLAEFIDVKGWKAAGNKLSDQKLLSVREIDMQELFGESPEENDDPDTLKPGDQIEFDIEENGQTKLF